MMETFIEITSDQFQEFNKVAINGPFQMINFLKFKDKVEATGSTGADTYDTYMKAVLPFFKMSKAKVIYLGTPMLTLIGPNDRLEWDKILIVEYASKENFIQMITSEGYPAKLRNEALIDSRLILSIT
ncbi:hypothetical protein J8281_07625 [Aquimarina sp. U1-2]|uniref:hypothetical protein n=1 Tax=Aquimarina sp. U1-2 TaxID=2823141 RepID=UPI001AED01C0|nr:hypothetical protein [Aquimarina sp. U1-2]MBP2832058.1 hypothetical protein [Aquimarina sp. U1-2]